MRIVLREGDPYVVGGQKFRIKRLLAYQEGDDVEFHLENKVLILELEIED